MISARFWNKIKMCENSNCWLWTGYLVKGYGRFKIQGKYFYAHRLAYEWLYEPIPQGLEIDHLCRITACVNPDHLEPVTHRVNMLRGISPPAKNFLRTHCVHGHLFDASNTYYSNNIKRRGWRACRACNLEAVKRYKASMTSRKGGRLT